MDHLDRLQQPTHERAPPPAPPGPLCFLVFVFPRPPAASGPPGRPLTVESKTLRPGTQPVPEPHSSEAVVTKVWTHPPKTLLRVVLSSASVLLSLS